MAQSEKCCFSLPLDYGCIIVGIITFIISLITVAGSVTMLVFEDTDPDKGGYYMFRVTHLKLDPVTMKIILCFYFVISTLLMVFSVLLIVGIQKKRTDFMLAYFSFGIMMTILTLVSGLLLMLQQHWAMAVGAFIASIIYLHCLITVYHTYQWMTQGDEDNLLAIIEDDILD